MLHLFGGWGSDSVPGGSDSIPGISDRDTIVDYTGRAGRYLTDGVNLYRFVGEIPGGLGEMVGLEDCRSLDVTLLPIGELRARRLRTVSPADGE